MCVISVMFGTICLPGHPSTCPRLLQHASFELSQIESFRRQLHILPFTDALCNKMNMYFTMHIHVHFRQVSRKQEVKNALFAVQFAGLVESGYRQSYSCPAISKLWLDDDGKRISAGAAECLDGTEVTEGPQLLWALGCSGQWWQQTGQANHSGVPRQWMQVRLKYL